MQHLLLLHGAIGAEIQFESLVEKLSGNFIIHTLNFSGHGGAAMSESFSISQFASQVLDYIDYNKISPTAIFGYSMGGYVALYLAKHHPEKVRCIFTLGTKFEWTPEIAIRETKMLQADIIEEKLPAFAKQLAQRHKPNDWKIVLEKTAEMMIGLGNDNPLTLSDFNSINIPIRIAIGDKDMMVTLEETIAVYRSLPQATLTVFSNTPHPIEKVDTHRLSAALHSFFI